MTASDGQVKILGPMVDYVAYINNEGKEPLLKRFALHDTSGHWAQVDDVDDMMT